MTGKGVYELVLEHDILSKEDLDTILKPERYILLLKPMYYYTLKIKKKEIPERSSPSSYLLKIILHIPDINDWA